MVTQLINDTVQDFIAYQHFVNEQYRRAFPNSAGYRRYVNPASPQLLPDGTPQEYALIKKNAQGDIIAGMRLWVACHPNYPALENQTSRIFQVPEVSLGRYLERLTAVKRPYVLEVGRLAFHHQLAISESFRLMRDLMTLLIDTAQALEADFLVGFARPIVINTLERLGIALHKLQDIRMNRCDRTLLAELVSCYEIKFPELQERLIAPLTQEHIDAMTLQELQMLVDGIEDGESVYVVDVVNPYT